jgi:Flp pilus assembly protein TadG
VGTSRTFGGRRSETGASAVEFALVAPILIILVFGVISFGMIFGQQLALGNAAREASRFGVVEGRTCAQVIGAARDAANTIGMSGSNVTVTVTRGASAAAAASNNVCTVTTANPCNSSAVGDSLFVKLEFTSKVDIPLVVTRDIGLTSDGVFRCEYA